MLKYTLPADKRQITTMKLFRRVMHPELHTLCFFGMLSTLGNEAAVGELQVRPMVGVASSLVGEWMATASCTGTNLLTC